MMIKECGGSRPCALYGPTGRFSIKDAHTPQAWLNCGLSFLSPCGRKATICSLQR